ncbi:MAG: C2 family cysteine protease [Candidatus Melainabacteria bacterium]|nr:C2 family cysteine protease [Candidatus Melainabacteria bacterium]
MKKIILSLALLLLNSSTNPVVAAPTAASAWAQYNEKKYVESADSFESVLRTSPPSVSLCYQAALANFAANRRGRARQLCQYIVQNFGTTREAHFAKRLFPELAAVAKTDAKTGDKTKVADAQKADTKPKSTSKSQDDDDDEEGAETPKFSIEKGARRGSLAFTPQQIAADGASGIDQAFNPNCWFEASMAALAALPKGQRLLASMIKIGDENTYIVRFPGDGQEYKITENDLNVVGVSDKSLWAALIECAQVKKFPDNDGSRDISIGMGCITGCKAQSIDPEHSSLQELSSFIAGAVSSKNPIICATEAGYKTASMPDLVVNSHAYTIIGFDAASGMITMRNPHGKHSRKYTLAEDPNHRKFEWVGKGVFKMHISLFQKYFDEVCRSFI